jgi:hypothetical protein
MCCVCACMLQPPPMPHNSELVCGVDRLECGMRYLLRLPSFCMLILGWPRASPGCHSLAAWALWILVVRFLPSMGRSPVGDTGTAPRRRGAGPAADHSKRIRLAPREALERVSLSAMPTALAVGTATRQFRVAPAAVGGCWDSTGKRRAFTLRLCWF